MWRAMLECHHAQFITISLAYHSRSSTRTIEAACREILAQLLEEFNDRSKNRRRPLSPRRALAPLIFVLCRDWSSGIKALPAEDLSRAIKVFVSEQQEDKELQEKQNLSGKLNNEETKSNNNIIEDTSEEDDYAHLCYIHESLTKVLSQMTKFFEASLKTSGDVKQKSQAAQAAYHNCKSVRTGKF
ncbi:hypothetical protein AHAS_Ahas10G0089000 [Arachis hypogaea]